MVVSFGAQKIGQVIRFNATASHDAGMRSSRVLHCVVDSSPPRRGNLSVASWLSHPNSRLASGPELLHRHASAIQMGLSLIGVSLHIWRITIGVSALVPTAAHCTDSADTVLSAPQRVTKPVN